MAAVFAFLPYGPRIGLAALRTPAGAWLLGPGLVVGTLAGAAALLLRLRRRHAPVWAYVMLGGAAAAYWLTFSWLRALRLERTHLPEYGIAAWLAWRALAPLVPGEAMGYAAAAGLGAAIGYGRARACLRPPRRRAERARGGAGRDRPRRGAHRSAGGAQRRMVRTKITASSRIMTAMKKPA